MIYRAASRKAPLIKMETGTRVVLAPIHRSGRKGRMPRTARVAPGGFVYHFLNRSVGRMPMFRKDADFEAFERVMVLAHQRQPIRILSYCAVALV